MLLDAAAVGRAAPGQRGLRRQVTKQLVQAQQRLLELRTAPAHTIAAYAAHGACGVVGRGVTTTMRGVEGCTWHVREQCAHGPGARGFGCGEAPEARTGRQDDG